MADAVDIELESKSILGKVIREVHNNKRTIIISYHNLEETPSDTKLKNMFRKTYQMGGDIAKIATLAKNREDVIRLMKITLEYRQKNIIAFSLANIGVISRIFFLFIGSLLTYGCADIPLASRQLPVDTLRE